MQQSLHQYLLPLCSPLAMYKWPEHKVIRHKVIRPVELLVVLTRVAAVTQLAAAAQQLAVAQVALAAVPIIGQQYSK
jgi:hypothetical protein